MRFGRFVLALAALLATARSRAHSSQTGEIFGKVTDQSGAVLPGVTVTLTGPVLLQPLVGGHQRNRHVPVSASRSRRPTRSSSS